MAQGRKGTGADKRQVGIRCPADVYAWIEAGRGPRETDTDRVLVAIEQVRELEDEAGKRLPELRAMATLEQVPFGRMLARLALEALDARRRTGSRKPRNS